MDEKELISQLKSNPEEGYAALIHKYSNYVYAVAWSKLKGVASKEDVEDCVSDIFVAVYLNFNRFDEQKGGLKPFISTIAQRTSIDHWRKLEKKRRQELPIAEKKESTNCTITHDEAATLWEHVKLLGEPEVSIIIQKYFYEETVSDIARKLHMSKAAVYKRLQRSKKKLKQQLMED